MFFDRISTCHSSARSFKLPSWSAEENGANKREASEQQAAHAFLPAEYDDHDANKDNKMKTESRERHVATIRTNPMAKGLEISKEHSDVDSDEADSVADELEDRFGVLTMSDVNEEKITDSDREIITSMKELRNHSWKPVDSLVVSISKGSNRMSAMKGSRSKRRNKKKREVSFQTVVVREYGMTLGDNPSCSYGPPVCLDWGYEETIKLKLEEYEKPRANQRRTMRQMVLSYYKRCDILESAGCSSSEIKHCTRQMNKLKRRREATKFFIPVQGVEAVVRSAGRKVKRAAGGARKE